MPYQLCAMPERCPRCRGLFQTRNGAYRKHIAMCRVALDGGTGGDSSGGSEEEIRSDGHRRGGGFALHCRRSPSADHAHDVRSLRRGPDRVSVPCGLRCRPVHSPPALPLFCREWFRAAELAGVARYGFEELRNEDGDRVYRGPLSGEWARHACGACLTPCACRAGTPRVRGS